MNNKLLIVFSILISLLFSNVTTLATRPVEKMIPEKIAAKQLDGEAKILAQYLALHNSPLQYHAQDFIEASKKFNVDWKLVPAIAGVESTFGKFIPGGYNAWGWGVYGNQALYFSSWREAIFVVTKGLRENYLDKGLTNPYSMNRIYATSPYWGGKVSYFMADLEKFSQKWDEQNYYLASFASPPKTAVLSGTPDLR